MVHYAKIEGLKIVFNDCKLLTVDLRNLEGKDVKIDIKKKSNQKTENQRNYLHLILTIFANDYGMIMEDVKCDLKEKFGIYEVTVNNFTGDEYKRAISSEDLDKDQYCDFITKTISFIRDFAPEFIIPNPDTYNLKPEDYGY